MQKLPSLIFLDKIEKTFSRTKITYFLLRCSRNVGGRDQIAVTNDHKPPLPPLFFFLKETQTDFYSV